MSSVLAPMVTDDIEEALVAVDIHLPEVFAIGVRRTVESWADRSITNVAVPGAADRVSNEVLVFIESPAKALRDDLRSDLDSTGCDFVRAWSKQHPQPVAFRVRADHHDGSGCKGLVTIEAVRPGSGTDG